MLLYVPEKNYKKFENDEHYHSLNDRLYKKYIIESDLWQINKILDKNKPEDIKELEQYVLNNCTKTYKAELQICFDDNLEHFLPNVDTYNDEIRIFLRYMYYSDLVMTDDLVENFKKIVEIYESSSYKFSPYIHAIYYFTKMILLMPDVLQYKILPNIVIKQETELFDEMMKKCDTESFKNIMYSKRLHFLSLYIMFISLNTRLLNKVLVYLKPILDNKDFKYNDFYFFKTIIYHTLFKYYLETGNLRLANTYIKQVLQSLQNAFNDKEKMKKSLLHYNKFMVGKFLFFCKYMYKMLEIIPRHKKYFDFNELANISKDELDYVSGKLEPNDDMEVSMSWFDFEYLDKFKYLIKGLDDYE